MPCLPGFVKLCLCLAVVAAMGMPSVGQADDSFVPLPRAEPGAVGVDAVALGEALAAFSEVDGAWAMMVVRNGAVVGETHVIAPPETLHPVWSVTKSITATMMGIAMDQGVWPDVEVAMVDHLPSDLVPSGPGAAAIRLRHLLAMTSGQQWSEDGDWLPWIASDDPERFILERPMDAWPGSLFNYSSASSHLPSVMLETASGEGLDSRAERMLFEPLGFDAWQWDHSPTGYPFGGHGVHLRVEDLAKFGQVHLSGGTWGARRVVPSDWVTEVMQPHVSWSEPYGPLDTLTYGYLWWLATAAGHDVYLAWGWGGQFAFCVPDLSLVVATAADGDVWASQAEAQAVAILTIIVDQLMPAVTAGVVFNDGFEGGDLSGWMTGGAGARVQSAR
jgi:CubicO group peptidase (beta-lactamase class C family)